ncbi:hypothetical protein NKJ71_18770 [Mesorhizobium sp. M0050]|uniref:hypothetical protein n=1 Tax=Mesorhizobium sp. M0050 TaxID=2956861 RepID=UPI0033399989
MSCTDCIICSGRRFLDEHDMPSCEACAPMFAAHVVSMRTDEKTGGWSAVCPCGWSTGHPRTSQGREQREADVIQHWRSIRQVAA